MLPTKELRTLSMCLQRSGGQAGEQDQRSHHGGITHFQQACTRALLLHAQLYAGAAAALTGTAAGLGSRCPPAGGAGS
jgi:hypothetical protein